MTIEIKGFKLPPLLIQLMEEGKWGFRRKITQEMLVKLYEGTNIPLDIDSLVMCNGEEMKLEEEDWKRKSELTDKEFFEDYYFLHHLGYFSSKRSGYEITDSRVIDLEFAILLADNHSEDAICLDYRENTDNPRVMTMVNVYHTREKETHPFFEWRVIAPDFETFARKIGLVE